MNSREHSEMPPAPSYPSPNATQIAQGTVSYYANQRHLTADELHLSAELSREVSATNVNDSAANGIAHGQAMVLGGASNANTVDVNRTDSAEHHQQQQQQQQAQQAQQQQQHQQQQQQQHQQAQQQQQQPQQDPQQQQQHLLQFPPNQQVGMDPNHDLSYGDQSARRKRSKVSRACDECRRKKVRCDATSEAGVETCSNCRRTGATCEFSRVPMKRGPSKGYIKELADRINSLESQMQPPLQQHQAEMHYQPMEGEASPAPEYGEFSPSIDNQTVPRKRTLSMSEGMQNAFMQPPLAPGGRPTSVGGWPLQTPTKDATHANDLATLDTYPSPNAATGSAKVIQPFWSQEGTDAEQQARVNTEKLDDLPAPIEIDDKVLDVYFQRIHPVLPILPNSRARLLQLIQTADRQFQEVFLHSLYAVTGANLSRAQKELQVITTFEKAQDCLYASFREDPQARLHSVNFVLLHSIILMILDADSRGPENLRGQNGISKTVLVEAAFGLVYHVAKAFDQIKSCNPDDKDLDSDGNLARKNWSVLMILSRWHTVGVACPDFFGIHETAMPEDKHIFGFAMAQLARYSTSLSEMNEVFFDNAVHPSFGRSANHALKRSLYGQLNRIKDLELYHDNSSEYELNMLYTEAICPLVFWSITLLLKRHLYTSVPAEIIYPAEVIIDILHQQSESPTPITSPFHFHFLALAVITLLEMTDLPELSTDAWIGLEKALQVISQREKHAAMAGEFEKIFANQAWEACIRANIEAKLTKFRSEQTGSGARQVSGGTASQPPLVGPTEQRSLEHLADLAVGAGGAGSGGGNGNGNGSGNANTSSPPPVPQPASTSEDKEMTGAPPSSSNPLPELLPPSQIATETKQKQQDVRVYIDFTQLTKRGYLNVLSGI